MSGEVLIQIASVMVGGVITWIVSWWYFKRAGDELRAEARELRKLTSLALVVITDPKGKYTLVRDAAGVITGLNVQLEARSLAAGGLIGAPALSTGQQPPSENGE
jgi:hypothetical protein